MLSNSSIVFESCSVTYSRQYEQLIRLVAGTEDHDELACILENEVLELPFVVRSSDGLYIPNGQDAHVEAANWLREQTDFDDFTIKATLSRLPNDWPNDE